MNLILRKATKTDVDFVAWAVLTAVGITASDEKFKTMMTALCQRDDTLYSWKNAVIAEVDGKIAGALICYDGANYMKMRKVTFALVAQRSGKDFSNMDLETVPGEFYLDSMAVLPEFRRQGIATALLKDGIRIGSALGITHASMIVSPEKPSVQRLYESLGFKHVSDLIAFDEPYRKMVRVAL